MNGTRLAIKVSRISTAACVMKILRLRIGSRFGLTKRRKTTIRVDGRLGVTLMRMVTMNLARVTTTIAKKSLFYSRPASTAQTSTKTYYFLRPLPFLSSAYMSAYWKASGFKDRFQGLRTCCTRSPKPLHLIPHTFTSSYVPPKPQLRHHLTLPCPG